MEKCMLWWRILKLDVFQEVKPCRLRIGQVFKKNEKPGLKTLSKDMLDGKCEAFSFVNNAFIWAVSNVVWWFTLLPHSKNILGLISGWGGAFLCWVCMFPLCLCGFPPGALVFLTIKDMDISQNPPNQMHWWRSRSSPRALHSHRPLLLGRGWAKRRELISLYSCALCRTDKLSLLT